MPKPRWQARIGLIFLSLALVAILNPEIRAALLMFDAIGLDLVLLLVSTQLRLLAPSLSPVLVWLGQAASTAGLYALGSILPMLLFLAAPRLMPAPLVMLIFLCAASELRLKGALKHRPISS